ncbi:hypothetical protein BD777DRAFT_153718 [Yarrowia lipolytica]|nr:hypothetical protein BD777DRAFT_153718 [Yarrowia lipolytica]
MPVSSVTPTTSSGETLCRALVTMTTCVSAKRRPRVRNHYDKPITKVVSKVKRVFSGARSVRVWALDESPNNRPICLGLSLHHLGVSDTSQLKAACSNSSGHVELTNVKRATACYTGTAPLRQGHRTCAEDIHYISMVPLVYGSSSTRSRYDTNSNH